MTKLLNKLPFAHHRWFLYLRLLVQHFLDDNCTQKSASLTYTTLLSIVPMIAVLLVVFSTLPTFSEVKSQIQEAIYTNLLPYLDLGVRTQIGQYLDEFAQKSSNVTTIGVIMLFATTIMTLITIETAFNQIWRVQDRTGGIKSLMRYWTMITLAPVILAVAFTASSAVKGVSWLNQKLLFGYGIDWVMYAQVVSFLVTVAGFVGMYWFIPKVNVPAKNALIAGVMIAVLFECIKRVFGFAIGNFTSYEAIYGAFAILPIFLLWIYVSWNLILLGVEISYTLTIFETKEVAVKHPLLSLLDMLNLIYKNYQNGQSTSEQALRDVLGRKELPKWHLYLSQLADNDLIIKTEKDEYTLKKDLTTISLWQFYKTLPYPLPIKDELDEVKKNNADEWLSQLQKPLSEIEQQGKLALSMPLSELFVKTPLREKQPIVGIDDDKHSANMPDTIGDIASFADNAKQVLDDKGNEILLPEGQEKLPTPTQKWLKRIRLVGKVAIQGTKWIKNRKNNKSAD